MSRAQIGIAVVEHNGKYLVGRRGPDGPLAGFAEFPGGKCREEESPEACACRECFEETGLEVEPLELLLNQQHDYDHASVDLSFWHCKPSDPAKVMADHQGYRWVSAAELPSLNFPPANEHVVKMITADR